MTKTITETQKKATSTINALVATVNDTKDDTDLTIAIQNLHPSLSPRAAKNLISDVTDFINGTITETQLALYLSEHGLI